MVLFRRESFCIQTSLTTVYMCEKEKKALAKRIPNLAYVAPKTLYIKTFQLFIALTKTNVFMSCFCFQIILAVI